MRRQKARPYLGKWQVRDALEDLIDRAYLKGRKVGRKEDSPGKYYVWMLENANEQQARVIEQARYRLQVGDTASALVVLDSLNEDEPRYIAPEQLRTWWLDRGWGDKVEAKDAS